MKRNLTVYVLIRNDLPSLNAGKAAAQVHHAGIQMMSKLANNKTVTAYVADGKSQGADHFNTTLTLGATKQQIVNILEKAKKFTVCDAVYDPSYPFFVDREVAPFLEVNSEVVRANVVNGDKELFLRNELTCAWFLGDRNDPVFKSFFDGLNLY